MPSPPIRSIERRRSTRIQAHEGLPVTARRVGRRSARPGVLWDASASGAMIELGTWLPLGTMLQLSIADVPGNALVVVVRSDFGREFERRYGVACLEDALPADELAARILDARAETASPLESTEWRWPTLRKDIRRLYRSMALKAHPDVGGSDERFRALHQSYTQALAAAGR